MANVTIVPLTGIRLPENGALLRDWTRDEADRDAYYIERYDRRTVIYDCVWREDLGLHVINAPTFMNLWAPFEAGLKAPGGAVRIAKRITWKRSEQVYLDAPREGLQVTLDGQDYDVVTRPSEQDRFAGLRCAATLNKNNRPEWIHDWARYYVRRHGLQGVALVDNGSDAYPLTDIRDALASVEGLKEAVIYEAPFPYGPLGRKGDRRGVMPKFFQSGMLNTMRDDALVRARSVLNVDIDELVVGPEDQSIFEATERHPLGMLTFKGFWAYPERLDEGPKGHADHRFRSPPLVKCNRKWCLAPNKFIGRNWLWDVHQVGGIFQNLFTEQRRFSHVHCRACSTGWRNKRFDLENPIQRDPALDALMTRYFETDTALADTAL